MTASSGRLSAHLDFKPGRGRRLLGDGIPPMRVLGLDLGKRWSRRARERVLTVGRIGCCCSDPVVPIRRTTGSGKRVEKTEEWRFDPKKIPHRVRTQASPAVPFASSQ